MDRLCLLGIAAAIVMFMLLVPSVTMLGAYEKTLVFTKALCSSNISFAERSATKAFVMTTIVGTNRSVRLIFPPLPGAEYMLVTTTSADISAWITSVSTGSPVFTCYLDPASDVGISAHVRVFDLHVMVVGAAICMLVMMMIAVGALMHMARRYNAQRYPTDSCGPPNSPDATTSDTTASDATTSGTKTDTSYGTIQRILQQWPQPNITGLCKLQPTFKFDWPNMR